ncbi:MAG: protein translocase subunit SecD [Clostridia bacterium]|nr:protein translocase subunit SecD [Clostridia bacterium]
MKTKNIVIFVIVTIIILLTAYITVFGITINGKNYFKRVDNITTGLDISGGVSVTYQAVNDGEITESDLESAKAVICKRVEASGIYDYFIRIDNAKGQIAIEIPADTSNTEVDPLEVVKSLAQTAEVKFVDEEGNVLISGSDIASATVSTEAVDVSGLPSPHVVLNFSDEGKNKFADATEANVGKTISIMLDDEVLLSPKVNERIESNSAIITLGGGSYSEKKEQAAEYATLINSGALPFTLEVINKEYIGAYVGSKALEVSVIVAVIVLALVCVFMIVVYRLQGLVASLALIAYSTLVLLVMSYFGISLTLPGIAGLILSVGMAVDSNILIFERFNEELKAKVSYKKAFERSFKNAMSAIVDGNVTTMIVALLLFMLGTSSVKGFGLVLFLGVLLSLFTAVFITKLLLKQILPLADKSKFLFGLKKEAK